MKVGILTFHSGQNYGASLQAYALKRYLFETGMEVQVLDFRKEKVYGESRFKSLIAPARILRKLYEIPFKRELECKSTRFKKFLSKYILENNQSIISEENIGEKVKQYDALIFGSDQIWNTDPRVYDKSNVFFGDFEYDGKKFAYAASFGDSISLARSKKEYISRKLKEFSKISVREITGKVFLEECGIKAQCSVDPTLLLDAKSWKSMIADEPIIGGEYVLYYSVNCRKYSWEVAKQIGKQTGLPVYNLVAHPKIVRSGFKNYYSGGPEEFLNILYNAKFVVTNSFHGVIFSIIFNKCFIPVFSEIDGNVELEERKYSVLHSIGLDSLITTCSKIHTLEDYNSVNWINVNEKLNNLINDSKTFLKTVVEMI